MQSVLKKSKVRWGLNGFTLKSIAMLTMLIDHIGMALFPQYIGLRIIGRLAFPIYCFLLVEGAVHTSNYKKYLGRMFLFACVSEIPFDLVLTGEMFNLSAQNVFFTLFMGLLAVVLFQKQKNKMLAGVWSILLVLLAEYTAVDYGGGGVAIILIFYFFRERKLAKCAWFSAGTALVYGGLQNFAIISLVPILCYNGKRGPRIKYLFYIFYPAHLLILYWLRF